MPVQLICQAIKNVFVLLTQETLGENMDHKHALLCHSLDGVPVYLSKEAELYASEEEKERERARVSAMHSSEFVVGNIRSRVHNPSTETALPSSSGPQEACSPLPS